ncbi:DUF427 domain-containing protein [Streptomyces sp. WAC 05379]|uniref:DUF427 domain-containing protein n=1 Tax=Streptomyces sp. WAC 05379 TaxID=2203207 RepID=UPI0021AD5B22|nr:DUF427 domain-containing protein [Streptomyces sp. WAC 05379]
MLLHEPGRYPVAYILLTDVTAGVLEQAEHTTQNRDLSAMSWYPVRAGAQSKQRSAWQHVVLPDHARGREGRVAFAWRVVDGFFEEDERIVGHVADACRRMDIPSTNRRLVARNGDQVVALSKRPPVLYESGCSFYQIGSGKRRGSGMVSFEPDEIEVSLGGRAAEVGARAERGLARRGPEPRPR